MMRFVLCVSAISALARATRAKSDDFAWPWDQDAHHARPVRLRSNMMATRSRTSVHDFGSSWDSSSFGDDSSQSSGDFMDQYISETGAKPLQITSDVPKAQSQENTLADIGSILGDDKPVSKPAPRAFDSDTHDSGTYNFFGGDNSAPTQLLHSDDTASFHSDSHSSDTASFASDMANLFDTNRFESAPAPAREPVKDSSDSDSDSGWPWSGHNKKRSDMGSRSRSLWNTDSSNAGSSSDSGSSSSSSSSASDTFTKMFSSWSGNDVSGSTGQDASPKPAPQHQDSMDSPPADSPIEGPTQRESSLSGASATDQVVDVRLSSELQQSLLQAKNAETKMFSRFRSIA